MSNDATTKPTIGTILERINDLRSEILPQLKEINSNIRLMNKKFDVVSKELLELKARQSDLEERLESVEKQPV